MAIGGIQVELQLDDVINACSMIKDLQVGLGLNGDNLIVCMVIEDLVCMLTEHFFGECMVIDVLRGEDQVDVFLVDEGLV
jgi:hypothetical protein